jgi:hypothetical protein
MSIVSLGAGVGDRALSSAVSSVALDSKASCEEAGGSSGWSSSRLDWQTLCAREYRLKEN